MAILSGAFGSAAAQELPGYTAIPIFRSATHFAKSMTQMPDEFTISQLSKAVQSETLNACARYFNRVRIW